MHTRHGWKKLCVWGYGSFKEVCLGLEYAWKGVRKRVTEVWNGGGMKKQTNLISKRAHS